MTLRQQAHISNSQIICALKGSDLYLAKIIDSIGPCQLERREQGFPALARSIISQQISKSAAQSIRSKVELLLGNDGLRAELFPSIPEDELRKVGLSISKVKYLKGLADYVLSGKINFNELESMDDEVVVKALTQIKGIGRWTAEMYLMFSMNRPDIFPIGDFAIRNAMARLYDIPKDDFDTQAQEIAEKWKPYRTIACWYLYKFIDISKNGSNKNILMHD